MSTNRNLEPPPPLIAPGDIYFVLFRHKKKILILTAIGLAGALLYYFTKQPMYQSDAELLVRYVSDSRPVSPSDSNSRVTSLIDQGQNVLSSEMEILGSFDLAEQVATNIGPDKILAKEGGGSDYGNAAMVVRSGLRVESKGSSCVIGLTFRHPDAELVRPVLGEIITDYLDFHVRVHQAIGMSDDSLSDETSKLRLEIRQTEDELRIAKTNAGIISLTDAQKSYQDLASKIHTELLEARASLAEHQTGLQELALAAASRGESTNSSLGAPADKVASYKNLCARIKYLERRQNDYIQEGFTDENTLVQDTRQEFEAATKAKADLENQYPTLADLDTSFAAPNANSSGAGSTLEPTESTESVAVEALPRRIKELQAQMNEIQLDAARLDEAEAKINDLERKKNLQEQNYNTFVSMLEQARIDEALGPGRVSNIQIIEQPSPPYKDYKRFYRAVGLLAGAGLFLGLAWAFLIEFYLDRSVKRPVDFKTKLRIPFFLSIPDLNHGGNHRLGEPEQAQLAARGAKVAVVNGAAAGALEVASPRINLALHSHYDALRDRLVGYFESINLTRKPKLVAMTSTRKGAGVSTIAAGLAASLSETGDGRVLLVDMNLENGAAQQFFRGQPECQLDDALASDKRNHALVQENLYVVSEGSNADKLPRILPKRFASLVPKLRASDYDYIIFDMPPVTQTSVTTRLAGFMDTVMLIVESEKTDRDVVKQAHELLQQSKANVTAVLNKTRRYVPARLQHDIDADV